MINANVFMEADKQTLAMRAWPPEIRENVDGLDKCKSCREWDKRPSSLTDPIV